MNYTVPEFEIDRNMNRCVMCGVCVEQCSYGVHHFSQDGKTLIADEEKCVACHRCAVMCPKNAIKIKKCETAYNSHANWTPQIQKEILKQARTGGVLLSGMSNNKPYPIYWDKMLLNASQVTNPSIDPLREPMEIRTFLGSKPDKIEFDDNGNMKTVLPPQIKLETPIMFSAMSFGSVSLNTQKALAMAAERLGTVFNTGEAACTPIFGNIPTVRRCRLRRVASACTRIILTAQDSSKSKSVKAQSPVSADISPEKRLPWRSATQE